MRWANHACHAVITTSETRLMNRLCLICGSRTELSDLLETTPGYFAPRRTASCWAGFGPEHGSQRCASSGWIPAVLSHPISKKKAVLSHRCTPDPPPPPPAHRVECAHAGKPAGRRLRTRTRRERLQVVKQKHPCRLRRGHPALS